jgi:hypothetical protein
MTAETKRGLAFCPLLYVSAFTLNFCWESWHGLLYEAHQELTASVYVPMMARMALFDAISVIGMHLFTAMFARKFLWRPSGRNLIVFCLAGALPAWAVEYVSVNLLHLWSYTTAMPVLFRVGLSPLLQLPLTGVAGIVVARAVAGYDRYRDNPCSRTFF